MFLDTMASFNSVAMAFPRLSTTFGGIIAPEPLEQGIVRPRTKFCIAFLLVQTIGHGKYGLLVQCAMPDSRSAWFAHLLEHPQRIGDLVTPYWLAEYRSQDACILERLCGTLCSEEC